MANKKHVFSVAPMLAYTNRHARFLYRLLSPNALLYTEMIHAMAVLSKKRHKHLAFSKQEHPVAVQLAGNDPQQLAEAAIICQDYGYDEINLNIGCPSNKVRQGDFGACLMSDPDKVSNIVAAMAKATDIPITIKCRLGIDTQEYKKTLPRFIKLTSESGCNSFSIHARMAWLKGLNPKQNRDVPPLDYGYIYKLKSDNPLLNISINGGIQTIEEAINHLKYVDGVMLGRAILSRPVLLQEAEEKIFGSKPENVIDLVRYKYADYAQEQLSENANVAILIRPLFPLFAGLPGGGIFRKRLAQRTDLWKSLPKAFNHALEAMQYYSNNEELI